MPAQRPKRRPASAASPAAGDAVDRAYLALLRRELTRSQARLKRAEWERDKFRAELERLRNRLPKRPGAAAKRTRWSKPAPPA
jgi:hypothetical protein